MKRHKARTLRHLAVTASAVLLTVGSIQEAFAEDNTGTGDVGGDAAALVDSNTFEVFSTGVALTLVKTAFLQSDGSPIVSGATVPQGTYVDFMIYVNNLSSVAVNDISIQDVLDPLFAYQALSIRVDNSIVDCGATCDAAEEAAIYASAIGVGASTDGIDGDTASFNGGDTVDAGDSNVANGTLNATANTVLAVVFTVQVQ